jgi:hypothetical protein
MTKPACSPSCEDYRPETNIAILCVMGYIKGRQCTGGIGQGKEIKNLNMVDVLIVIK